MAWTVFSLPSNERGAIDRALKDDLVSRQSQTVRDATALGGPSETTYVLVEGSAEGVKRAEELLGPVAPRLPVAEAEALYRRFKDAEESASAGMGLFFTEG